MDTHGKSSPLPQRKSTTLSVLGIDGLQNASEFPFLCRFSAASFAAMVDAGVFAGLPGVGLWEGLPARMNAQHMPHGNARNDLYDALFKAVTDLHSPLRVLAEMSIRVSDDEVPFPDVFVWEPLRGRGPVPVGHVRLVVEVSDATQREDLGCKRAIYAVGGIPEYWVVDLVAQRTHQHRTPRDDSYVESAIVPFGEELRSRILTSVAVETSVLLS